MLGVFKFIKNLQKEVAIFFPRISQKNASYGEKNE